MNRDAPPLTADDLQPMRRTPRAKIIRLVAQQSRAVGLRAASRKARAKNLCKKEKCQWPKAGVSLIPWSLNKAERAERRKAGAEQNPK